MIMASHSKRKFQQHILHQHVLQQHHHVSDSQSGASLPKLPVEILDMIAFELDNQEIRSMRATCRHLYAGLADEFAERHTSSNVEIMTANGRTAMRRLTVTLRSPDLVKAKATMTQVLSLHGPLYADEKHPEKTSVSNIVTSNPSAWSYQQQQNYRQNHGYCLAPQIFKRIADLPPQITNLRQLVIEGAHLNGDDFLEVLLTHKHHLRRVTLRKVILTKFSMCVNALCRSETQRFEFEDFKVHDARGRELYVTKDLASFPKFKSMMRWEWKLLAGFGRTHFVYERKSDTERAEFKNRDFDAWMELIL
jgi:hypothetical protein